jgi:hypothetical protein
MRGLALVVCLRGGWLAGGDVHRPRIIDRQNAILTYAHRPNAVALIGIATSNFLGKNFRTSAALSFPVEDYDGQPL